MPSLLRHCSVTPCSGPLIRARLGWCFATPAAPGHVFSEIDLARPGYGIQLKRGFRVGHVQVTCTPGPGLAWPNLPEHTAQLALVGGTYLPNWAGPGLAAWVPILHCEQDTNLSSHLLGAPCPSVCGAPPRSLSALALSMLANQTSKVLTDSQPGHLPQVPPAASRGKELPGRLMSVSGPGVYPITRLLKKHRVGKKVGSSPLPPLPTFQVPYSLCTKKKRKKKKKEKRARLLFFLPRSAERGPFKIQMEAILLEFGRLTWDVKVARAPEKKNSVGVSLAGGTQCMSLARQAHGAATHRRGFHCAICPFRSGHGYKHVRTLGDRTPFF